jgi:hypothetical protein
MRKEAQASTEELLKRSGIHHRAKATMVALAFPQESGVREGGFEEDVGDLQLLQQQDGIIDHFLGSDLYFPTITLE